MVNDVGEDKVGRDRCRRQPSSLASRTAQCVTDSPASRCPDGKARGFRKSRTLIDGNPHHDESVRVECSAGSCRTVRTPPGDVFGDDTAGAVEDVSSAFLLLSRSHAGASLAGREGSTALLDSLDRLTRAEAVK